MFLKLPLMEKPSWILWVKWTGLYNNFIEFKENYELNSNYTSAVDEAGISWYKAACRPASAVQVNNLLAYPQACCMLTCPPASEVPEHLAVPRAGVSRKEGVQLWPDLCPLQKVAWMQSLLLVLVKGQQGLRGPRSRESYRHLHLVTFCMKTAHFFSF